MLFRSLIQAGSLLTLLPLLIARRQQVRNDWQQLLVLLATVTLAALLQSLLWHLAGEDGLTALLLTLTGGLSAGRRVLDYSRANIARSSLELGGKTPAIVAADADLEKAATDIVRSKTTNCGQLCTAVERVYVQEDVHDALVGHPAVADAAAKLDHEAQMVGHQVDEHRRLDEPALVQPIRAAKTTGDQRRAVIQTFADIVLNDIPLALGNDRPHPEIAVGITHCNAIGCSFGRFDSFGHTGAGYQKP